MRLMEDICLLDHMDIAFDPDLDKNSPNIRNFYLYFVLSSARRLVLGLKTQDTAFLHNQPPTSHFLEKGKTGKHDQIGLAIHVRMSPFFRNKK
jgi:hypothetical protein